MKRNWNRARRPSGHHKSGRHTSGSGGAGRSYDSVGPEVKLRGKADQIYKKYQTLARDVRLSGDRVRAESLLQHAEHYYRLMGEYAPQAAQELAANGIDLDDGGYIGEEDAVPSERDAAHDASPNRDGAPPNGAARTEPPHTSAPASAPNGSAPNGYEHDGEPGADGETFSADDKLSSPDVQDDRAHDGQARSRRRGPLR